MFKPNLRYSILSNEGFKPFVGVQETDPKETWYIELLNGTNIKCSENHRFRLPDQTFKMVQNLYAGDQIEGKNGPVEIYSIKKNDIQESLYDIIGVEGSTYLSNDIVSHNCEFLGSSHTLISSATLRELRNKVREPIRSADKFDVYEMPVKNNLYAITVDVSRGLGLDSSAFSVIDVSEIPYRQVAKYKNNTIDALLFPTQIYNAARLYNDAYVLVEISDIGEQVANILHHDLEYENLVKVQKKGQQGQQISSGHVKKIQFGVKTSQQTKKSGCANIKTLIEMGKLQIWDEDTIAEFETFIQQKDTYKAEDGYHDDLAMTLVLFGWFISQKHVKDALSRDLRSVIQHEHLNIVEDDVIPFITSDEPLTPEEAEEGLELQIQNWEGYMDSRRHSDPFDRYYGSETIDYISLDLPKK